MKRRRAQIERGIPIPEHRDWHEHKFRRTGPKANLQVRGNYYTYPFRDLAVGESFVVLDRTPNRMCAAIRSYKRYHGSEFSFTVRKEGSGARVWRTV